VHLATIAQSNAPPSTNAFADLARTDEDSTADDGTPDSEFTDTELSEHGDSHTLLNELMQLADPLIDGPSHAGEPIVAAFNAHDRDMTLAITQFVDSINNPDSSGTPPATMDPMMLMLHTMQNTNQAILACLDTIDATIKLHHTALNDKADSSEITRLDQRLTEMTQSVRDDIAETLGAKVQSTSDAILDLGANLKHLTKKFDDSEQSVPPPKVTRVTPDPVAPAEGTTPIVIDVTDGQELTGRHHNTPAPMPSPLPNRKTVDPTGVLGTDIGYGPQSGPPVNPDSDGTYTCPTGHFGSGLGGPTLPITPTVRPTPRDSTAENAHAAHMAGPAGRPHRLALVDPYTPSRPPPRPPQITPPVHDHNYDDGTHGRPSSPGLGSPILSPRAHQERVRGVNRFDIELLAHPLYHSRMDGVRALTVEFLANCGYNMIPSDDVVGSLNEIITAH
jgi:hypothetical protein